MYLLRLSILLCLLCFAFTATANRDTITINEVVVNAHKTEQLRHDISPVQTLNRISLTRLNALQVSDAVKSLAGVQVKDYGGIGGLKTVSVRSLGAKYTAVSYDGVLLADEQSGQVDLGKLSIDNVQSLSLASGLASDIFAPAKSFASGSLLCITTTTPSLTDSTHAHIAAGVKIGSFYFVAPSITYTQNVCKKFAFSVNGELQFAGGTYPYTLTNGDTQETFKRINSDIRSLRLEGNIYSNFSERQRLAAKIYLYHSERGLPGSTIFYYPHSSQRLWDKVAFAQLMHQVDYNEQFSQKSFIKYNHSYTHYLDPDYLSSEGMLDNRYTQNEIYASTSLLWNTTKALQFSTSLDGAYSTLDANLTSFAYPARTSIFANIAGKYTQRYFDVVANALGSFFIESVEHGIQPDNTQRISPAVTVAIKPLGSERLLLRAFYKDIFRMPSFNDLYYGQIGNPNLRPEKAQQYNVGVAFYQAWQQGAHYVSTSVDGYRNYVTDKIVAIPTKDLFVLSMINMGKVQITGLDVTAKVGFTPITGYSIALNGSYTYQKSIDKTNPQGKTYNHQIPYTPLHSGSAGASLATPYASLDYNVMISGNRYTLPQNNDANTLSGYADHSIAARKSFSLFRLDWKVSVEVLNLLDTQYEVIRYFPMPGRSFRGTLTVNI